MLEPVHFARCCTIYSSMCNACVFLDSTITSRSTGEFRGSCTATYVYGTKLSDLSEPCFVKVKSPFLKEYTSCRCQCGHQGVAWFCKSCSGRTMQSLHISSEKLAHLYILPTTRWAWSLRALPLDFIVAIGMCARASAMSVSTYFTRNPHTAT